MPSWRVDAKTESATCCRYSLIDLGAVRPQRILFGLARGATDLENPLVMPPILVIAYAAVIGYLRWNRSGRDDPRGTQATPNRKDEAAQRGRVAKTGDHGKKATKREIIERDGGGNTSPDDNPTAAGKTRPVDREVASRARSDLHGSGRDPEVNAAKDRVAIYIGSLYDRTAMNLARELGDRGFDVDLVVNEADGLYDEIPNPEQVFSLGFRYLRFKRWHLPRSLFELSALVPRLSDYLRRRRPSVLLASLGGCNIVSLVAAREFRELRVIVDPARYLSVRYAMGSRRERRNQLVERTLYRWADIVVAETKPVAEDLVRTVPEMQSRVRVVPRPVVRWDEIRRQGTNRVEHPWMGDAESPVVLAACRLDAIKDLPTLLRAFALVRRARPARLVIVGEGPEREGIWTMARDLGIGADLALPGFQRDPLAWMARARVFVVSSLCEGGPRVLPEAMACGTTPVSTDCPGGPRDILGGGRWGELVPVGDHVAVADAISRVIDHRIPPNELKRRADDYSVSASGDQYEKLIRTVIAQPRSRTAKAG